MKVLHRLLRYGKRKTARTVTHVNTQEPVVALTFDDGPDPVYTPALLEILAHHKALATFFMVGKRAANNREIVRQAAEAGHAIGNHTWDHASLPRLSHQKRIHQLRACSRALAPYGQQLLRPPHGHQTWASELDAYLLGYTLITWNVSAVDWLDHEADSLVERVKSKISPGSIILFHDGLYHTIERRFANPQPTLFAVQCLLQELGHTYRFVTVPDLLQHGTAVKKVWRHTGDINWLNSLQDMENTSR